nr:integrase [uncultured bacterium]
MDRKTSIGPHHLAHLRAVADGLEVTACAKLYLGIEDYREAQTAHDELAARMRLAAKQAGHKHYRLIGARIRDKARQAAAVTAPTLTEYIEAKGLDGWSEEEQIEMYQADYPPSPASTSSHEALQRRERSRQRVVAMLRALELDGRTTATPTVNDEVSAWFADHLAKRLIQAGFVTLGQLGERIRAGGAWYSGMPGIGRTKAGEIIKQLEAILPGSTKKKSIFEPSLPGFGIILAPKLHGAISAPGTFSLGTPHRQDNIGGLSTDAQALAAWVQDSCESTATKSAYEREGRRFLFWLRMERQGKHLSAINREDVEAYKTFLAYIPERWIGRAKRVPVGSEHWSPFMGQLSPSSQRQAQIVLNAWYSWMLEAEYVRANPWRLKRKKRGQDRDEVITVLDTNAMSEAALNAVIDFLEKTPPSPDQARALFAVRFLTQTGLRSSEFVNARIEHLSHEPEGLVLRVTGKGSRTRAVILSGPAQDALNEYLEFRGLGSLSEAPPSTPLFPLLDDTMQAATYQALYKSLKEWLPRAIEVSHLTQAEKSKLRGISGHWLRHTYGTRAIAAGVPPDVVQAQLGHASLETTMSIYSRAPLARQAEAIRRAFG